MGSFMINRHKTVSSPFLHQNDTTTTEEEEDLLKYNDFSKIEVPLPYWLLVVYCHAKGYNFPEVLHFFKEICLPIDQIRFSQYKGWQLSEEDITFIDTRLEFMRMVRLGSLMEETKTYFWDFVGMRTVGFTNNEAVELLQKNYCIDMDLYKKILPYFWDISNWDNYNNMMFKEWLRSVDFGLLEIIEKAFRLQKPGILTRLNIEYNVEWACENLLQEFYDKFIRAKEDKNYKYAQSLKKDIYKILNARIEYRKEKEATGKESEMAGVLQKLQKLSAERDNPVEFQL